MPKLIKPEVWAGSYFPVHAHLRGAAVEMAQRIQREAIEAAVTTIEGTYMTGGGSVTIDELKRKIKALFNEEGGDHE